MKPRVILQGGPKGIQYVQKVLSPSKWFTPKRSGIWKLPRKKAKNEEHFATLKTHHFFVKDRSISCCCFKNHRSSQCWFERCLKDHAMDLPLVLLIKIHLNLLICKNTKLWVELYPFPSLRIIPCEWCLYFPNISWVLRKMFERRLLMNWFGVVRIHPTCVEQPKAGPTGLIS